MPKKRKNSLTLPSHFYMTPMLSAMQDEYMLTADGFLLFYSVTSRESFERIPSLYKNIIQCKGPKRVGILLVANKSDLVHERVVSIAGLFC